MLLICVTKNKQTTTKTQNKQTNPKKNPTKNKHNTYNALGTELTVMQSNQSPGPQCKHHLDLCSLENNSKRC